MPGVISVIVPVHNGERYLNAALNSVAEQTYRPLEVIVVDDGSIDGTAAIAAEFFNLGDNGSSDASFRYVWQANAGAAAARNAGIALSRGSFLAFLDADDTWMPNKLTLQMNMLEEQRQIEAVFGSMEQFISPDVKGASKSTLRCPSGSMPGYTHCTMLIRREAFSRVGMFETDWQVGEFVAWYLRAMEAGLRTVMLADVVMKRRLHASNQGVEKRDYRADYVRILKASLDRRRHKSSSP